MRGNFVSEAFGDILTRAAQSVIEGSDVSLVAAAQRALTATCGPHLDTWNVGKIPAGVLAYSSSEATSVRGMFTTFADARRTSSCRCTSYEGK